MRLAGCGPKRIACRVLCSRASTAALAKHKAASSRPSVPPWQRSEGPRQLQCRSSAARLATQRAPVAPSRPKPLPLCAMSQSMDWHQASRVLQSVAEKRPHAMPILPDSGQHLGAPSAAQSRARAVGQLRPPPRSSTSALVLVARDRLLDVLRAILRALLAPQPAPALANAHTLRSLVHPRRWRSKNDPPFPDEHGSASAYPK